MARQLSPDICVIGAGSGRLSVAAAAAAFGVDVILVERGKMGGDCPNYGCAPSKALIGVGMWLHDIIGFISPYPTIGGIGKRAATSYFAGRQIVRHMLRF